LAILFVLAGVLFKTVETCLFFKYQDALSFLIIIQSYFNIIVAFCLYALIILPFYFLIALLEQKSAQIFASFLFSLLTLLEIGLFIYYKQTGVLMGTEIVIRPISETLMTIRNSSDIITNSILIILVVASFTSLPFFLKKIKILNKPFSLIASILIIGIISTCTLFYQNKKKKKTNNYLEIKILLLFLCFERLFNV
jgi:hypothetical protein